LGITQEQLKFIAYNIDYVTLFQIAQDIYSEFIKIIILA